MVLVMSKPLHLSAGVTSGSRWQAEAGFYFPPVSNSY